MRSPIIAPEKDVEPKLAAIWRQLLGVRDVGKDEHFFDLGGRPSLLARMREDIRASIGADIRITDLPRPPTIRDITAFLQDHAMPPASSDSPTTPPLSSIMRSGSRDAARL
jgi:hypothetical protein